MQSDKKLIELIQSSDLFDAGWYSRTYPDVSLTNLSPLDHFSMIGLLLNRDPGPKFNAKAYFAHYSDVKDAGIEAFRHYLISGRAEGRNAFPVQRAALREGVSNLPLTLPPAAVDIIVPVFNALSDVKKCLRSIESNNDGNANCIVVNDGSNQETAAWLTDFCQNKTNFSLINNLNNLGYTKSVNVGLKASKADFVILLNSDTIVSRSWIDGLLRCAKSDPRIGIVGPLSNAASWQNVPALFADDKTFAINPLPQGVSVNDMADIVESTSLKRYPSVGFVNGFCFLIKRSVIDAVGFMDELNFPKGYGEENDYCVRVRDAGFTLNISDDTYVYHAKSRSFGHDSRKELSTNASRVLDKLHTKAKMDSLLTFTRKSLDLEQHRSAICTGLAQFKDATDFDIYRQKIVFLLPAGPGGGGSHSVVQEASDMLRRGINVKVAVRSVEHHSYLSTYTDIQNIAEVLEATDFSDTTRISPDADVVIATIYSSAKYLAAICSARKYVLPAYYIQDYEPMFYDRDDPRYAEAFASYTAVPGSLLFAKTDWIRETVAAEHGVTVHKVQPSIDRSVYRPKKKRPDIVTLAAMIRPQTPRRGAARTMKALKRLAGEFAGRIKIETFGCNPGDKALTGIESDFSHTNNGVLNRPQVAEVLQRADIFLDLSDYQAFGRTALEAMACGATSIITKHGGVTEFARDGANAILVDPDDADSIHQAASSLITNIGRLRAFQIAALAKASRYSVSGAALSELAIFATALIKHRQANPKAQLKTLAVVPDTRGDKKPTGSAFVRALIPYQQSGLLNDYRPVICPARELPQLSSLPGVALLQRRLPGISLSDLDQWALDWRAGGGRIVFDIDDDLLDEAGLTARHFNGDFEEMKAKIIWAARTADTVVVSTPRLATRMRAYNANVLTIPNYLDAKTWHLAKERPEPEAAFRRSAQLIRIGYVGTPTHDADLAIVESTMHKIAAEFAGRVKVEVVGAFENKPIKFGEKIGLPRRTEYPNFVEWLFKRTHWDIGIVPLAEDAFNLSKSNLKFLECSALGMGLVVSDVPAYKSVAKHGKNCLVAKNTDDAWYTAIKKLILEQDLRRELEMNARRYVAEYHTTQRHLATYQNALAG